MHLPDSPRPSGPLCIPGMLAHPHYAFVSQGSTPATLLGELLSICWSWFACQWRARAVPGNSFPQEALCPWRWLPLPQLPFPCGSGWNCDFAENQTLSWLRNMTQDTNNPATARKCQVHELRLRYQAQLYCVSQYLTEIGTATAPIFSWGNRDTVWLNNLPLHWKISSHLELDIFDCLPWKAWNSSCWSFSWWKDRPVRKQQRPIKEWRGQELNGECGQMGHPSSVWTEQAQNQTESPRKPPRLSMWREEAMFESLFEAWPSRWRRPGSYRCFTCVLHGQFLVWYQEGYLWVSLRS